MKIISWNCNGALRKKTDEIDSINADLLIIQECENPAHSTQEYYSWAGNYLWIGDSKHKGVGVFPKGSNTISPLNWNDTFEIKDSSLPHPAKKWITTDLKLFLPFSLNDKYTVLAVWTKGNNSEVFSYIGQFWKYLQIHRNDLPKNNTLIIGDFNSNSRWDKPDRWWNHSDVINELEYIGIQSLYHHQFNEKQGKESSPTFYLQKNIQKPYHIDYVFCSENLLPKSSLIIGNKSEWLTLSDHVPLIIDIPE